MMWSGAGLLLHFIIHSKGRKLIFFEIIFSFGSKVSFVAIQLHNFICGQSVDIEYGLVWRKEGKKNKNELIVI